MKTVFDPAVRAELLQRANALTMQSERKFGTMRPDQSLHHINLMLRASFGESPVPYHGNNMQAAIGRLVFFSPMPLLKGKLKAPAPLEAHDTYDLEREKSDFRALLDRYASASTQATWPVHPIFGKLSHDQEGKYAYKESDHHLKQFGV